MIKVRSWTFPSPNGTTYKPSLILRASAIHITSIKEDVYFACSNHFDKGEKKKSVCVSRVRTSDSSFSDNVVANLQRQIDECKKGLTAKGTIIDSTTAQVLQITEGSNVDDALLKLAMPEGKYALQITLLSPGNRPIPNVAITGITTITGGAISTDANGKAFGFATSNPVTITADLSTFLDLTGSISQSFSLTSGIVNQGVMTATRSSETQKLLTSSGSFHFSPDVAEYDWSAIGGGHNGRKASISHIPGTSTFGQVGIAYGGNGGDAGGVINQANVAVPSDLTLNVIVGAANGGKSSVNGIETGTGVTGGTGGHLAQYGYNPLEATPGLDQDVSFLYPPTSVGGSGGGGKCCYQVNDNVYYVDQSTSAIAATGGSPGGGAGGSRSGIGFDGAYGKPATKYGAGGGGAFAWGDHEYPQQSLRSDVPNSGGAGKQGVVGFMWRFKS